MIHTVYVSFQTCGGQKRPKWVKIAKARKFEWCTDRRTLRVFQKTLRGFVRDDLPHWSIFTNRIFMDENFAHSHPTIFIDDAKYRRIHFKRSTVILRLVWSVSRRQSDLNLTKLFWSNIHMVVFRMKTNCEQRRKSTFPLVNLLGSEYNR